MNEMTPERIDTSAVLASWKVPYRYSDDGMCDLCGGAWDDHKDIYCGPHGEVYEEPRLCPIGGWIADREKYRLLAAAVNEDSGECLPECDSFGHAEKCKNLDMAATLINLRRRLETAEHNHIERKHIDATPNEHYPLRILRAYRADCNGRWADTSYGHAGGPLTIALNEMQDRRAAILDKAIAVLAGKDAT